MPRFSRYVVPLGLAGVLLAAGVVLGWSALPPGSMRDPALASPSGDILGATATPARTREPGPAPSSDPPSNGCDAEVAELTAEGVRAAVQSAGPNGTVCFPAGDIDGPLEASVEGQVWRLDRDTVLRQRLRIDAPRVTIVGGRVEIASDDPWADSVVILADDARIEGVTFRGGGLGVSVRGHDRTAIVGNDFADLAGTSIAVWGDGRGADDVIVENNRIVQTRTRQASPIISRGTEQLEDGVRNTGLVVRGNDIDQGDGEIGWYGIELKASPGALIEANDVRGGSVLVSVPDSDDVTVRGNRLDLRGSPYWAVELPNSHRSTVIDNVIVGDGLDGRDTAFSMNSGSQHATIRQNVVEAVRTLVDLSGDHHLVSDNCVTDVRLEFDHRSSAGDDVRFERNAGCAGTP